MGVQLAILLLILRRGPLPLFFETRFPAGQGWAASTPAHLMEVILGPTRAAGRGMAGQALRWTGLHVGAGGEPNGSDARWSRGPRWRWMCRRLARLAPRPAPLLAPAPAPLLSACGFDGRAGWRGRQPCPFQSCGECVGASFVQWNAFGLCFRGVAKRSPHEWRFATLHGNRLLRAPHLSELAADLS